MCEFERLSTPIKAIPHGLTGISRSATRTGSNSPNSEGNRISPVDVETKRPCESMNPMFDSAIIRLDDQHTQPCRSAFYWPGAVLKSADRRIKSQAIPPLKRSSWFSIFLHISQYIYFGFFNYHHAPTHRGCLRMSGRSFAKENRTHSDS